MAIGNSRGSLEHLTRDTLAERWWSMSPTSQLVHHPFGAAVARLSHPAGASGGGGEGWSIPLVSQSERTRRRTMDWSHCARDAQMLVGVRERLMQPPGTAVCASEIGPIFVAVPVTVLCLATFISAWHGEAPWGGGLAAAALAVAILAVVSLLAGAVWLSIADSMTEIRRRAAWAAIGAVTDQLSNVPPIDALDQCYHLNPYVAVDDGAVRAVLDAHRHSMPLRAAEEVTGTEGADERVASLASVPSIPQVALAASGADSFATDNACSPMGRLAIGAALRVVSSVNKTGSDARKSFRMIPYSVAPSDSRASATNIAARSRRTVNGGRGDDWSECSARPGVMGLPIRIVSNIFVRAQAENGPLDDERLTRPKLDSSRIRAGPSTAGSDGLPGNRARHQTCKELDSIGCTEAKRQVIALAEALARQAAREDDAAEHAAERSAGPDADTLGFGRNGGEDDTSG